MYTLEKIIRNIHKNTTVVLKETKDLGCYGLYYPTKGVIVYDPTFGDTTKVIETIIHELTHYIAEREGKALDTLNNELLAFTAERVILDNADITKTVIKLLPKIKLTYHTTGVVIYTDEEIGELIDIVKKIIGDE